MYIFWKDLDVSIKFSFRQNLCKRCHLSQGHWNKPYELKMLIPTCRGLGILLVAWLCFSFSLFFSSDAQNWSDSKILIWNFWFYPHFSHSWLTTSPFSLCDTSKYYLGGFLVLSHLDHSFSSLALIPRFHFKTCFYNSKVVRVQSWKSICMISLEFNVCQKSIKLFICQLHDEFICKIEAIRERKDRFTSHLRFPK